MSDFHQAKVVKSRKHRKCYESGCRRTNSINPGDFYSRATGRWEGGFYSYALCLRCQRAFDRIKKRKPLWDACLGGDGPGGGELLEWLKEARGWL